MELVECATIKRYEDDLEAYSFKITQKWKGVSGGPGLSPIKTELENLSKRIKNFKLSVRAKFRKPADYRQDFSATRNGNASCLDWQQGFLFANKLGNLVQKVEYYKFSGSTIMVVFYTQHALDEVDRLDKILLPGLNEIRDLVVCAGIHID